MADETPSLNFFQWLLEAEIRVKNAISGFAGLLAVASVFLFGRQSAWFQDIVAGGTLAIVAAFVIVLSSGFLLTWLLLSGILAAWERIDAPRREAARIRQAEEEIVNVLNSLTPWQRQFILRFIAEDVAQIEEWHVGGHRAVWEPQMEVLVRKGVILRHPSGIYEIHATCRQFLQRRWNPATQSID